MMAKPERLEALGRIRELMQSICDNLDDKYGQYLDSKHAYESFEDLMLKADQDALNDLHFFLRHHKEKLEEILYIAIGD